MLYLELGRIQTAWAAGGQVLSKGFEKFQGRVFLGALGVSRELCFLWPYSSSLLPWRPLSL